jgi:capsid protein
MRSHLNNFEKSIIGNKGFKLQSLVKNVDGILDEKINQELEAAWYDFGKRSNGYITKDGQMGDLDLDALILRTLAIDGEVFIRVDLDAKNPYGLSF